MHPPSAAKLTALLLAYPRPWTLLETTMPHVLLLGGTHNWRDVMDDVDVRLDEHGVHRGVESRTDRILSEMGTLPRSPLLLAGFSLGGAVAVRLASKLPETVHSVHAFGAPKVGDAAFVDQYRASGLWTRTWRYVTPLDPVPRLPPGYRHVGREIHVPSDRTDWLDHHDLRTYRRGLLRSLDSEK